MAPRHGLKKLLGIYEPEVNSFINKVVKAGDVCFDLGAHIGYTTLLMRKLVGKGGALHSFEPVDESFTLLSNSIKKNNFKNVFIHKLAIGDRTEEVSAHVFEDSGMANFKDSGFDTYQGKPESSAKFKIETLDNFVKEASISKIDFIKIDVEGYEKNVLQGTKAVVDNFKPRFLIEVHNEENYVSLYDFFHVRGYEVEDLKGDSLKKDAFRGEIIHVYCYTNKESS